MDNAPLSAITKIMDTIQKRLRATRQELGLTQGELAKRAGIAQPTYCNLENVDGKGSRHLVAIAQVLGVRPEWLQSGRGPKSPRYTDDSELDREISELWSQIKEEDRPLLVQMLRAAAQKK